ncbi:MAG: family 10 glycosylhydrolase [Phycisphaerales bacterium]|nr:MAG: family 10 glycosylhydrolase [Phycisphaerales bacterium]
MVASLMNTGCQAPLKRPDRIRGIWVTRMDYKTESDIVQIMENCKSLGLNTVIFQIRGNGTVFYPSKIEPWAEQFNFTDPSFDPLKVAIREAHKRGLLLEAYVNVMPAWRGPDEPANRKQLYHTHPEWFWYDKDGKRQPLVHQVGDRRQGWYVSLNPCLPEVREYLVEVFHEIVSRYDVDALHLDYIRFPNERVVPGEKIPDYPRDARTLALYKADTGLAPDDNPERWMEWRADQVTRLVRDIHAMVKRTRPRAVVTAAVGANPERSKKAHFRDSRRWAQEGLLDVAYPMNYTADPEEFRKGIENWADAPPDVAVAQGIGVWRLNTREALLGHVRAAEDAAGHFCLFAYSSFFETADDPPEGPSEERTRLRAMRVAALREHLASKTVRPAD